MNLILGLLLYLGI